MKEIDRLFNMLDKIDEKMDEQATTLSRHTTLHEANAENLKEHMRRTEASEKRISHLEKYKWMMLGMVALVIFLANFLTKFF